MKKPNWSTALFPLAVLSTLAGLSFWLLYATSIEEEKRDGKDRHDPDYIISGMTFNKLDKNGRLQYTLTANELVHFPDDDSTDVTKPHLVYLNPKRPTLTISSLNAQVSSGGETVYMKDDVHIHRAATPTRPEMTGDMDELTVQTEEETAETQTPVHLTQGKSWVKGVGMQVDNVKQTYLLKSQVVGEFESKKSRATP